METQMARDSMRAADGCGLWVAGAARLSSSCATLFTPTILNAVRHLRAVPFLVCCRLAAADVGFDPTNCGGQRQRCGPRGCRVDWAGCSHELESETAGIAGGVDDVGRLSGIQQKSTL